MPIIKREQNLTECLNNAIQQQRSIFEETFELLRRPDRIWEGQYLKVKKSKEYEIRKKKVKQKPLSFYEKIEMRLQDFIMDDKFMPMSRRCALVNMNSAVQNMRLPLALLAVLILMYEAPKLHYGVVSDKDMAVFVLDKVLNLAFLIGATVRALSVPMLVRVAFAFEKEASLRELLFASGGLRDIPAICLCFGLGFSPLGMWVRLLLLMSLTPWLLEALPQISILLGSITRALGSISITICLYFMAILIYASFGHVLFRQNDPFHFGTYGLSVWTFFRFSTFDNWSELWNLNYYGCHRFPSEDITQDIDQHDPVIFGTRFGSFEEGTCRTPVASPVASTLLFVSYLFLCAYVLINTCMAAVVIGIKGGLDAFKSMTVFAVDKKIECMEMSINDEKSTSGSFKGGLPTSSSMSAKVMRMTGGQDDSQQLERAVGRIWDGEAAVEKEEKDLTILYGSWSQPDRVAAEYERIINSEMCDFFFLGLCAIVPLLEILTEMNYFASESTSPLHAVFQGVFTVDVVGRLFTFTRRPPKQKQQWGWLLFNGMLSVVLWVPVFNPEEHLVASCHMLRLVSALQFLSWVKDLELIMTAFTVSCYGILLLGVLVLIAFFFFAIAAVMLFKQSDPYRFGSIPSSFSALIQLLTYDDFEMLVRTNMLGCGYYGYDSGIEDFDNECRNAESGLGWIAPIFFGTFSIVCTLILMSALIGLIISAMENLMEIKDAEVEAWDAVEEVAKAYEIPSCAVPWLLELFEQLDKEENCHLTFPLIQPTMTAVGISQEQEQFNIFLRVDRDGSGQIEFPEFMELISIMGMMLERTAFGRKKSLSSRMEQTPDPDTTEADGQQESETVQDATVDTPVMLGSAPAVDRKLPPTKLNKKKPAPKPRGHTPTSSFNGDRVPNAGFFDSPPATPRATNKVHPVSDDVLTFHAELHAEPPAESQAEPPIKPQTEPPIKTQTEPQVKPQADPLVELTPL